MYHVCDVCVGLIHFETENSANNGLTRQDLSLNVVKNRVISSGTQKSLGVNVFLVKT